PDQGRGARRPAPGLGAARTAAGDDARVRVGGRRRPYGRRGLALGLAGIVRALPSIGLGGRAPRAHGAVRRVGGDADLLRPRALHSGPLTPRFRPRYASRT